MNINRILICCLTSIFCMACGTQKESVRQHTSFNNDWTFHLGDVAEAIRPDYDDSGWRKLNLPHDWAIEGAFSAENPSGAGGGALPGGIGWYRKVFTPGKEIDGKRVFIDFDGVYMNSEVFINGQSLGIRPFGYISFRYDLTPYLKYGEPNVMAVRVDNSDQPNSRWYSGCGIYRNTWLTVTHPVHIDQWGTYLTTPEVSAKQATVAATTIVKNDHSAIEEAEVQTLIYNAEGKKVAQSNSSTVRMAAGDTARVQQQMILDKPHLWDVESPYLYTVRTEIRLDGQLVDTYDTPLGVRSFRFDAERGFILNGREVKIKESVSITTSVVWVLLSTPVPSNGNWRFSVRWVATAFAARTIHRLRNCSTSATAWASSSWTRPSICGARRKQRTTMPVTSTNGMNETLPTTSYATGTIRPSSCGASATRCWSNGIRRMPIPSAWKKPIWC